MNAIIEEIKKLEALFSDNQYNGHGASPFYVEEGNIPIMVSAPHAVNHFRMGGLKWADMYTGGIARYLHQITGCHLIYSCRFTQTDPNYDPISTNDYQNSLKEYIGNHKVIVLLDLHGAAKKRDYAVEMGTAPQSARLGIECSDDPSLHGYTFIAELIKMILEGKFENLSNGKKEVWKNRIFNAGTQNTVTKFISENTNTACIQLEINGIYRDPENEEEFLCLVGGLQKIINVLAAIDWDTKQCIRKFK